VAPSDAASFQSRSDEHAFVSRPFIPTQPRFRAAQFNTAPFQRRSVRHSLGSEPSRPTQPRLRAVQSNPASFPSRSVQHGLEFERLAPPQLTRFFKSSDFRKPVTRIILKIRGVFAEITDESDTGLGTEGQSNTAWFQSRSVQHRLVSEPFNPTQPGFRAVQSNAA
jgi:hypothetical protein